MLYLRPLELDKMPGTKKKPSKKETKAEKWLREIKDKTGKLKVYWA